MSCIRRLVVAALVFAPSTASAQSFTGAARNAVADTIRREADRVISAFASKDIARFAALFTDAADLVYVDNGRIYPDKRALVAAAGGFFRRIGSAGGRWEPAHVVALADVGAFTGIFRPQMTDTAGTPLWVNGKIWTFVYERREGRWVIVQAHEVNALPAR